MSLPTINAIDAKRLLAEGASLVDIREPDEHARERIEGAVSAPLSRLDQADLGDARVLIFHCKSGMRTKASAERLAARAGETCEAYVVEGGLEAMRAVGVPVRRNASAPLEMSRQVQIGAGSIGLAGTLLGVAVSPWFLAIPAFVGAGLIFAGVTGFCGMAKVLALAPWNRSGATAQGEAKASAQGGAHN